MIVVHRKGNFGEERKKEGKRKGKLDKGKSNIWTYVTRSFRSFSFFNPAKAILVPGMYFFGFSRYSNYCHPTKLASCTVDVRNQALIREYIGIVNKRKDGQKEKTKSDGKEKRGNSPECPPSR